jgi:hypothetical protein
MPILEPVSGPVGLRFPATSPKTEWKRSRLEPVRDLSEISGGGTAYAQLRTSLRSSRSPFPGKSDFGAQRQNGHNVRGSRVREIQSQVDPVERTNRGYLASPREISAVRRLIGGAMRTRTKDPLSGYAGPARRIRGAEQIVHLCLGQSYSRTTAPLTIVIMSQSVAQSPVSQRRQAAIGAPVRANRRHQSAWTTEPSSAPATLLARCSMAQKDALLKPLGEQAKAGAVPEYNLDEVGPPAPEHEEVARERILAEHALDQHGEPIDALAHIGVANSEVHLHALRKRQFSNVPSNGTSIGTSLG